MVIHFDGDHCKDYMMGDEDAFESYPRVFDPEFSEKKLGMGKFADVLSQRSLSTSTPCVQRIGSSKTVEDDSGYVDSFADSLWSTSETKHFQFNADDGSGRMDTSVNFISPQTRLVPKLNVNLYSDSLSLQADCESEHSTDDIFTRKEFTHDSHLHTVQPSKLRHLKSCCEYPCIDEEDISLGETSVASISNTSNLNTSGLADRFAEVLRHFSPPEPDRLIGRKMLLEHVDIIGELDARNLNYSCVSIILGYLEATDLCRMCQVNRQWKKVCHNDSVSNKRMRHFINRQKTRKVAGKENYMNRKSARKSRGLTTPGSSPLKAMQLLGSRRRSVNDDQHSTPSFNSVAKRELFDEAARSLQNDESLCFCPKCRSPARKDPTQERAQCFNEVCSFDFCVKCQVEFHGASPCIAGSVKKSKPDSIGSKKSKKNLQRLLRRV